MTVAVAVGKGIVLTIIIIRARKTQCYQADQTDSSFFIELQEHHIKLDGT